VSTWLVYAGDLREHLDQARRSRRQALPASSPARQLAGLSPPTQVSLRTDLALARDESGHLRTDNAKLRRPRLQLGAEIDGPSRAELTTRAADLETVNRQLLAERGARVAEAEHVQRRNRDLEDDLTAARESLDRPPGSGHPDQILISGSGRGAAQVIGQLELALGVARKAAADQQVPGPPGGAPS
jgi:hypothetical protein